MMWIVWLLLLLFAIIASYILRVVLLTIKERKKVEAYIKAEVIKKFDLIVISNVIIIKKSQALEIDRYILRLLKKYFYPSDLDKVRYQRLSSVLSIIDIDCMADHEKFEKFKRDCL